MKRVWVKGFVILAIVLVAFFVLSERRVADYPSNWPEVLKRKDAKCTDLSGVFLNVGEEAPTNEYRYIAPVYLGMELLPNLVYSGVDPKWAEKVALKVYGDTSLEVGLWEKDKRIYHETFNKTETFSCTQQYIVISESGNASSHIRAARFSSKTEIGKAADGSIIVRSTYTQYGLFAFLIPYRESTVQWYRFLPVNASKE